MPGFVPPPPLFDDDDDDMAPQPKEQTAPAPTGEEAQGPRTSPAPPSTPLSRLEQCKRVLQKHPIEMYDVRAIARQGIPDCLRGAYWRVLLNFFPLRSEKWAQTLDEAADNYNDLVHSLLDMDMSTGAPRSNTDHYRIDVDIPRTMPALHFFACDDTKVVRGVPVTFSPNQQSLRRVLYLFAKCNPGLGYVQGMNELVGHMLYTFVTSRDEAVMPFTDRQKEKLQAIANKSIGLSSSGALTSNENFGGDPPSNNEEGKGKRAEGEVTEEAAAEGGKADDEPEGEAETETKKEKEKEDTTTEATSTGKEGEAEKANKEASSPIDSGNGNDTGTPSQVDSGALRGDSSLLSASSPLSRLAGGEGESALVEPDVFFCFQAMTAFAGDTFCRALDADVEGVKGSMDTFTILIYCCDAELSRHLDDIKATPELYAFRWLTVFLSQEFLIPDVLRIWDFLFSFGSEIRAALFFTGVAMLVLVREDLMKMHFAQAIQFLQAYPPPEDINMLLNIAEQLIATQGLDVVARIRGGEIRKPIYDDEGYEIEFDEEEESKATQAVRAMETKVKDLFGRFKKKMAKPDNSTGSGSPQ